jgi:hypothetical protein
MYKLGDKFILTESSHPEYNGKIFMLTVILRGGIGMASLVCLKDGMSFRIKQITSTDLRKDSLSGIYFSKQIWSSLISDAKFEPIEVYLNDFPLKYKDASKTVVAEPRSINLRS